MSFAEESTNTYFTKTDLQGNYTYVSPHFIEIFNLIPADIYGTSSLDTIYFEDHAVCYETVRKCFMNPKTYQKVIMRKPVDTEKIIWTKWEFYIDTDEHGNPTEMLCYGQNISDLIELKQLVIEYSTEFKEKETKFKTLFETSSLFIILHTAKGEILEANQIFCDHVGINKDLIVNYNLLEFTDPKNHQEYKNFMSKRIVGLGEISLETEITNKEGSVTPVSINPRAFHNEKGEIFIWTIAKDITERKNQKVQLENQNELLENQNELLEQTADIAKLGGWEIDLETSKTKWTKEVYKIHDVDFDYSHNADNVLTFYHPDDLKMVLDAIEHTKNSGESFELKTRFITAKGENKWLRISGGAILNNGKIVALKGIMQDITTKKLAEETIIKQKELLQTQNELLEQTAEIAKLGGWEIHLNPFRREWTEEVYIIHDLDPKITHNIDNALGYYHPDDRPLLTEAQNLCKEKGTSYDLELRLISAKKINKWVRLIGKAIYSDDIIQSIRGTVQDITEKKNIENIILKQQTLLKEIYFMQSHTIRLPLANILGLVDLLTFTLPNLDQENKEIFEKLKFSANQLDEVIRQVAEKEPEV